MEGVSDYLRQHFQASGVHILQAHFAGVDLGRVRFRTGVPWYVLGRPRGYASPSCIRLAADRPSTEADHLALVAHELTHVRQYAEHGTWRFRWRYLREYLAGRLRGCGHRAAYLDISYEREARTVAARVRRDLVRCQAGSGVPDRPVPSAGPIAGSCRVAARPGPLSARISRPR